MTHYPMTRFDLTEAGNGARRDQRAAAATHGKHARPEPPHHHAAGTLPAVHIMLLTLSAAVVLAAVLLVAFA